jgi:hypothetical protein
MIYVKKESSISCTIFTIYQSYIIAIGYSVIAAELFLFKKQMQICKRQRCVWYRIDICCWGR